MGLLDYFRSRRNTATVAKERLKILVAHERAQRNGPSYLPNLRNDILAVIRKYVEVEPDAIKITVGKEEDCEILELNVTLPERTPVAKAGVGKRGAAPAPATAKDSAG
jgi:cell division topological specificity factor